MKNFGAKGLGIVLGLVLLILTSLAGLREIEVPKNSFSISQIVDAAAPQAQALTTEQRILLFGKIRPAYTCSYLAGALCGAELFTATGLATQFDSTGKLTYRPNNLLTQSNTFNTWTSSGTTVTSGFSDPVGGTGAWRLQGTGAWLHQQTLMINANVVNSIWVKSNTGGSQTFRLFLNNSTISSDLTATTTWQQLSFAGFHGTNRYGAAQNIGLTRDTAGNAADILIYKAVAAAVTYETTPRAADQVITTSVAYYGPRFDYTYNDSSWVPAGLLIEGAATNIALNSNNLADATWTRANVTLSTDGTLGPDGLSIGKVTTNSPTTPQIYNSASFTVTTNAVYTHSWVVKKGSTPYVSILSQRGNFNYSVAVFDISGTSDITASQTAVGSTSGTITSAKGKYLDNGLYRLTLVSSEAGTSLFTVLQFPSAATGNTFDNAGNLNEAKVVGVGATSYAGYVQVEQGSFATSYTPTGASAVTRAAEMVQLTGAALAALQGASGTAIVQTTDAPASPSASEALIGSNAVANMFMRYIPGPNISSLASDNTALNTSGSPIFTSPIRTGVAWGPSSRSLVYNGGTVATDAKTFSGVTSAWLGVANGGAQYWLNGHIASVAFWTSRLPDATLQAKSIVGASYAANDNGIRYAFANDNLPVLWRLVL